MKRFEIPRNDAPHSRLEVPPHRQVLHRTQPGREHPVRPAPVRQQQPHPVQRQGAGARGQDPLHRHRPQHRPGMGVRAVQEAATGQAQRERPQRQAALRAREGRRRAQRRQPLLLPQGQEQLRPGGARRLRALQDPHRPGRLLLRPALHVRAQGDQGQGRLRRPDPRFPPGHQLHP